ncbi:MAG: response regulator, partial [Betaproteobacteria bacterium]|nr:response regulator [Betaproteobacteria bacterium]
MIAIEKRGPASDTGINILLVEDNPADVRMMVEALNVAEIPNRMFVVSDGEEALAFLRRENAFSGVPRPDVIVLDLKLPRKSGHEVLAAVKGDADLCTVPVVVLTSSRAEKDM